MRVFLLGLGLALLPLVGSAAETADLRPACDAFDAALASLPAATPGDLIPDAAVFGKAARYLIDYPDRAYGAVNFKRAADLLTEGRRRIDELTHGTHSWTSATGFVCRGYRSAVDGDVQPYVIFVPAGADLAHPQRLDVILHGRSKVINEVSFLASGMSGQIFKTESGRKTLPDCLKLYVYGRGNTSYRWSGESDVWEALAAVRARYPVDPDRIVLRGFSMGGAGAWHLGLHFPSRWAAVEAGSGFVTTRPETLGAIHDPWRIAALTIHDAADCALNLTDVPFVAYGGELDPIAKQNDIIRHDLERDGVHPDELPQARFLVGPHTGHNFEANAKKVSEAFIASELPRHEPASFRFVAYTPSYGEFWDFRIDSLDRLYERAELSGSPNDVHTRNVWVLKLTSPRSLELDGQSVAGDAFTRSAEGRWTKGTPAGLRKRAGLQGPIDDAFQQPFLCVEPTNGPDPVLETFRADYAKHLYAHLRIAQANAVTTTDVASYNLALFGTPETNPWVKKVLPDLPIQWTKDEITVGSRRFSTADSTLVLIYPNPLNPDRYVVLNSGSTYPGNTWDGIHWEVHPRFGDYAVLDRSTRAVKLAGYFNRNWQL